MKRVANKIGRLTTGRRQLSKLTTRKATHARLATVLEAIPNVGASIARDLRSIGIKQPRELIGRDPHSLYQALCDRTRTRQDPCVLDTFISAVRFMEGAPVRPWWSYTAERKKKFPALQPRRRLAKAGPPWRPQPRRLLANAFGVAPGSP